VFRTRVKICGLTRAEDVLAAAAAGADAVGLVFYAASPRAVSLARAVSVLANMPAFVTAVGLFVNAERSEVIDVCDALPLGLLQFHGDEDLSYCRSFGKPWMKAIRVSETTDIEQEAARYSGASALLLDSFRPGVPGGTGEVFDWRRVPESVSAPVVLAGGLTPANVGAAISRVRPYAVDVSGGVESAAGIKDAALMQQFIAAAHAADNKLNQLQS
jgi:phosphoribosylanthranilate isomerase